MSKFLIVGLGNIGVDYANTRHNIGFDIVDKLAEEYDCSFKLERLAHKAEVKYKGRSLYLIKPTTYMNLSGKAVRYWMQNLKIPINNILVVVDDKDLDFGKLRMKPKGNDGGHNGLKDITLQLNTNAYPRLRFGIGNDFAPGQQIHYVLGKWTEEENAELDKHIKKSIEGIKSFATLGIERTMNTFN
ncbi:MAG: aminoacyl-tRNA hydrolase [Chitinophagales bacterium]